MNSEKNDGFKGKNYKKNGENTKFKGSKVFRIYKESSPEREFDDNKEKSQIILNISENLDSINNKDLMKSEIITTNTPNRNPGAKKKKNLKTKFADLNSGRKYSGPNFTPLLDSLRNSVEKSPFSSKISMNEKYEKSSLFQVAQKTFQKANYTLEEDEESEKEIYENIFSDGDSSVGTSKKSDFLAYKKDIINFEAKKN